MFKNKWVLIIAGGVLCITLAITGIHLSSLEPRAIRKALSDNDYPKALELYKAVMDEDPSGLTAEKMVDTAMASKTSGRLYQTLWDIFPHLETAGVSEAFTRGGLVWMEGAQSLNSDVRWLAEQLTLIGADVTQPIRTLYKNTADPGDVLKWSSWVSELTGMDNDCLRVLTTGVMEYIAQQPWPDTAQVSSNDLLVQVQTLLPPGAVETEMLNLWLHWYTLPASELSDRAEAIPPQPDQPHAQVYWLLRALALTSALGDGWEHPLGADVETEFQAVYPNLSSTYRKSMFRIMYERVQNGPIDKLTLLMEVAATNPQDIVLDSAQEAVELLHTLADSEAISEFVRAYAEGNQKPVTTIASDIWSKRIVTKLAVLFQPRWRDNKELQAWSDIARTVGKPISSTMEVVHSKEYEEIIFPLYTSWSRPVLIFRDSRGVVMFDLEKWQERVVPGNTFALSPDGSRLVTLEWKSDSSVFRIYDMEGNQLDGFNLEIDLRPKELEIHWRTKLSWPKPDQLYTYYFGGEGYVPPFEDSQCSINISSREYTHSTDWVQNLTPLEPGVFRDYEWNLYDGEENTIGSSGTKIDNGQNPDYDSYHLGKNRQLTRRNGQLLFIDGGSETDITPAGTTVDSILGAAITDDAVYMELSCPPYWSEYPDTYCYSLESGEIEQLMQPAWQQPFADNRVAGVLTPDDKPVPLIFDSDYSIEVYCNEDSYYLAAYHWRAQMYGHFELTYPLMLYTVREK